MICTAGELLAREGLAPEETAYAGAGDNYLHYPMSMGDFFERVSDQEGRAALRYKRHLRMDRLEAVCRAVPALKNAHFDWLADRPVFTEDLGGLGGADHGALAVEGGPCLYGSDEVYAVLQLRSGARACFDQSSGACLTGGARLAEFLRARGGEAAELTFLSLKIGFSSQELELFAALFGAASALGCPLVLSLPDMSYRKYFDRLARFLPPGVRERAAEAYGEVVHGVTDRYLALAGRFRKRFPVPGLIVLHERNREAYETFLRARERFCTLDDVTTNRADMRAAIHDYITLPAAPYYLLGAGHVLEINSTDEADPLRKCAKFHKKAVRFHQLMLPEPVGADGRDTVFTAKRENKGYVLADALTEAEHGKAAGG